MPPSKNKRFNISNGNNVINAGQIIPAATLLTFDTLAAKRQTIEDFAEAYNYEDYEREQARQQKLTQTKEEFFNTKLIEYISGIIRGQVVNTAIKKAASDAGAQIDAELP